MNETTVAYWAIFTHGWSRQDGHNILAWVNHEDKSSSESFVVKIIIIIAHYIISS